LKLANVKRIEMKTEKVWNGAKRKNGKLALRGEEPSKAISF